MSNYKKQRNRIKQEETWVDMVQSPPTNGSDILLPNTYILWSHDIHNKNWDIKSYKKLFTVKTVSDFWKLFNNFHKFSIKFIHFFLMKEGVEPVWEHPMNRGGGVCSFKIEINNVLQLWEYINVMMMCGKLSTDSGDINGVSISPKNNWAILKVWNRDSSNDLTQTMHPDILKKYKHLSVKYKSNSPEY